MADLWRATCPFCGFTAIGDQDDPVCVTCPKCGATFWIHGERDKVVEEEQR